MWYVWAMKTESVRIKSDVLTRIRDYIDGTGQTISGYINVVLEHQIGIHEMDKIFLSKSKREQSKVLNAVKRELTKSTKAAKK